MKTMHFVIVLMVVLAVGLGAIFSIRHFQPLDHVTSLESLHTMNLKGELDPSRGYVYNGYSFVLYDGLWYTSVKVNNLVYSVPLHFGPKDVHTIKIIGNLSSEFSAADKIYLSFDPTSPEKQHLGVAIAELGKNLVAGLERPFQTVCDRNTSDACLDRPVLDCSNQNHAVIHFGDGSTPEIELKGMCIEIRGQGMDLIKATERLIYQWYHIM